MLQVLPRHIVVGGIACRTDGDLIRNDRHRSWRVVWKTFKYLFSHKVGILMARPSRVRPLSEFHFTFAISFLICPCPGQRHRLHLIAYCTSHRCHAHGKCHVFLPLGGIKDPAADAFPRRTYLHSLTQSLTKCNPHLRGNSIPSRIFGRSVVVVVFSLSLINPRGSHSLPAKHTRTCSDKTYWSWDMDTDVVSCVGTALTSN